MNSNKEAIQKKVAKMKVIREKVIRGMEDNLNECRNKKSEPRFAKL